MRKTTGKVPKMYDFAPNGNQLESRRSALIHMIKENQPEDGINFMRKSWTLEGFEENIYLPQGWKFKETSSKTSNGISVSSLFTTNIGEDNKGLPDGWKVKMPEGKNESKETAVMAPSKPKKEKKSEAVNSKFGSTVQVERRSVSPHELEKVDEPSKTSPNQGLSSSDKSLLKAKTMAFPFQHGLTQTDAHFKFKDKQKRTNKFVSIQVSLTAKSIQDQRSQNKDLTKPNLQLQLNRNQAGIIETKSEPHQGQPLANKKHFQRSYIIHNIVKVLAFHGRFAHDTKLEYGSYTC